MKTSRTGGTGNAGKHTERAFEDAIEHSLVTAGGWTLGDAKDLDRERAISPPDLFRFIEATQNELWAELKVQHREGLQPGVLDALLKAIESRGTLDVVEVTGKAAFTRRQIPPVPRQASGAQLR